MAISLDLLFSSGRTGGRVWKSIEKESQDTRRWRHRVCASAARTFTAVVVIGRDTILLVLTLPPLLSETGPPDIHSGIKDLKVLKTTQSGFEGFIKDQFTTLTEVKDRCFATQVYCKWRYQRRDVDFEATWYEKPALGARAGPG